jgi:hypothetical protein
LHLLHRRAYYGPDADDGDGVARRPSNSAATVAVPSDSRCVPNCLTRYKGTKGSLTCHCPRASSRRASSQDNGHPFDQLGLILIGERVTSVHNLGISSLVICGLTTAVRVTQTVRELADRSLQVVIGEDACIEMSQQMHEAALLAFSWTCGRVRPI